MRSPRFLLLLLTIVASLAIALLRPLPGRAGGASAQRRPKPAGTGSPFPPTPLRAVVARVRPPRKLQASRHVHRTLALGLRVVRFAKGLVGVPYRYGGVSPGTGFDCSGFVRYVYAHFGISLAHSSYADLADGHSVARSSLRPGDLVFFDDGGHVGIYVGDGRFIHAPHTGTVVSISTMNWFGARFAGARRLS